MADFEEVEEKNQEKPQILAAFILEMARAGFFKFGK